MKKLIKLSVAILCVVMMVTGCNGDLIVKKASKRRASTGTSWTVMIYMSGSSLEEEYNRAGEVLNSLSYDLPENVNVIVETGGCGKWNIEGIPTDKLCDFEVQKNGIRLIGEYPIENMGKASTYSAFLNRTIKNYSAQKYISVIWGEGGGPLAGVAQDSLYENDSLTPSEIAQAIASTETKLDLIGFDSGMMANLETATALVPYVDYMVASEDIMSYAGWDYRGLFGLISENPDSSVIEVGQEICDGIKNIAWKEDKDRVLVSVIDLADITKLMQDFDSTTREMTSVTEDIDRLRGVTSRLDMAEYMGGKTKWEGYSNLVDLKSFTDRLYDAFKFDRTNINRSISKAVVYKTTGTLHKDSCGISVYYPKDRNSKKINEYKKICTSLGYKEFIDKIIDDDAINRDFNYNETSSWQVYSDTLQSASVKAEADLNGKYLLYATNPQIIKSTGVNLYKYDEKKGIYLYLTTDFNTSYNNAINAYEYKLTNKQLELNGIPVSSYLVNVDGDTRIYSIPVIYEDEISSVRVEMNEKEKNNEYRVLGIWDGEDSSSGSVRRRYNIPGVRDKITPIFETYGEGGKKYVKGKELTLVFGGLNVKEKALSDGEYLISYAVEDIYGKLSESNTANVKAIKGKMQILK